MTQQKSEALPNTIIKKELLPTTTTIIFPSSIAKFVPEKVHWFIVIASFPDYSFCHATTVIDTSPFGEVSQTAPTLTSEEKQLPLRGCQA